MATASSSGTSNSPPTGSPLPIPLRPLLLLRCPTLVAFFFVSAFAAAASTATPHPVAADPTPLSAAASPRRRSLASFFGTTAAATSTMPPSPPPSVPPPTAPEASADDSSAVASDAGVAATDAGVVAAGTTVAPKTDEMTTPDTSSRTTDAAASDDSSSSSTPPKPRGTAGKVLYLIRHAETVENVQTASLIRTGRSLSRLTRPRREDVRQGMSVLKSWVRGHADSGLSELGMRQVEKTGRALQSDEGMDFLRTHGITTVVHSPLERARRTSAGVLGCVAAPQDPSSAEFAKEHRHRDVGRVVQLDCLREATPHELAIPGKRGSFHDRMREFERWVEAQDDGERIAVVGHSHFFMEMLNLSDKFRNCDVWKVEFSPPSPSESSPPSVEAKSGERDDDPAGEGGASGGKSGGASAASGGGGEQQSRRPSSSYASTYSSPCRWSGLELVYRYQEDGDGDGERREE